MKKDDQIMPLYPLWVVGALIGFVWLDWVIFSSQWEQISMLWNDNTTVSVLKGAILGYSFGIVDFIIIPVEIFIYLWVADLFVKEDDD